MGIKGSLTITDASSSMCGQSEITFIHRWEGLIDRRMDIPVQTDRQDLQVFIVNSDLRSQ